MDVTLRIAAGGAYRVYDEFKEENISKNQDGSFFIHTSLPQSKWLIRYLLSFGTDMQVLAPHSLRDIVRNELAKMMEMYEGL